ncbi:MAG TPA: hypothetical protein PLD10_08940 [Rhodopila sp.]|nr:hypothetical protein [Rhodopila sp.]
MPSRTPAHDYLLPRLTALVDDAVASGIARDVAVAVLIDLVTSPRFNTAEPDRLADSAPHPGWERTADSVVLVHGVSPQPPRPLDAQDEADFVRPNTLLSPS